VNPSSDLNQGTNLHGQIGKQTAKGAKSKRQHAAGRAIEQLHEKQKM